MKKNLLAFLFVAFPKVFSGVATTVFNLVLLRHVGPEQFGIYSLSVAIVMMADATFGTAIDTGVIRLASRDGNAPRPDSPERGQVEFAALLTKLMVCLTVGSLLMVCAEPLGQLVFHGPGHGPLITLIVLITSGLVILRSVLVSFQIAEKFILYGCFDFLHSLLKFGIGGLLVLFSDTNIQTLLLVFAAASTTTSMAGLLFVLKHIEPIWKQQPRVARSLMGVVKIYFMTYLVTATISRLDLLMLNHLSGLDSVGLFSGAQIVTMIPEMIGSYMAIVASPKVIPYCREGRFGPVYKRFQMVCFSGSTILFSAVFAINYWFGQALVPAAYSSLGAIILCLLPGAFVSMSVMPLTVPFLMFFRPWFFILMDSVSLPLLVVCYFFAIKHHGVLGAALVTSASRLVKAIIAHHLVLRSIPHHAFAPTSLITEKAIS